MTIERFDSELADLAESVTTSGMALAGIPGNRLLVVSFPEEAFGRLREALVRASEQYQTSSTATTLWALLDPFLEDSEIDEPETEGGGDFWHHGTLEGEES